MQYLTLLRFQWRHFTPFCDWLEGKSGPRPWIWNLLNLQHSSPNAQTGTKPPQFSFQLCSKNIGIIKILYLDYLNMSPDYITESMFDSYCNLKIFWTRSVLLTANSRHGMILLWISSELQKWLAQIPWLYIWISWWFFWYKINLLQSS